jgi:Ca-activated chloride channel family protein
LPDIFAGTQLIVTGRYRQGGPATITLEGTVNGQTETFEYEDLTFSRDGGQDFIPRLWATRKIGYLLNQVRLHGETDEAIDQIVNLSIRYGIITPYTSFLVEEPENALSQAGRDQIVEREVQALQNAPAAPSSGAAAVDKAVAGESMESADMAAPMEMPAGEDDFDNTGSNATPVVKTVGDKAFVLQDETWTDTAFDPETMETEQFTFASPDFLDFLAEHPEVAKYFAVGEQVIVVIDGQGYQTRALETD